LQGDEVDARADVFAFGAVLYELVRGRKVFEGTSQATVISAILSAPYPAGSVTIPALDRVIATCLAKDRESRWTSMQDVRLQLEWIADLALRPGHEEAGRAPRSLGRWPAALWALAAGVALAGFFGLRSWTQARSTPVRSSQRVSIELGARGTLPL